MLEELGLQVELFEVLAIVALLFVAAEQFSRVRAADIRVVYGVFKLD